MSLLMTVTVGFTVVNFLATAALTILYGRLALQMRSAFTIGLVLLASLFLLQNSVALYQYLTMMDYLAPGLEPFALLFALLQTASFATMLWLATR